MIYLKKNFDFFISSKFIVILVSFIYSILIGSGYIGFGIDYLVIYQKHNVQSPTYFDYFGWKFSTLSFYGIHLGAYLVSFLISLSCGFLCRTFFKKMHLNSLLIFLIVYVLIIFSWPAVISSNNAMRQGTAMSFIFFSLILLDNKKIILSIFFLIISLFTHKSSAAFFLTFIFLFLFKIIQKDKEKKNTALLFGLIYFLISFLLFSSLERYDHDRFNNNVIIGINFIPIFFLINIIYIIYFSIRAYLLKNNINLYLYFFSMQSIALLPSGLFWQYERYNLTSILLYIFSFATCIVKDQIYIYLIAVFSLLLTLTFLTGMYTVGIGIFPIF